MDGASTAHEVNLEISAGFFIILRSSDATSLARSKREQNLRGNMSESLALSSPEVDSSEEASNVTDRLPTLITCKKGKRRILCNLKDKVPEVIRRRA